VTCPPELGPLSAAYRQQPPQNEGGIHSLCDGRAPLKYRWAARELGAILARPYQVGSHVVGGGFTQFLALPFTADACNRPSNAVPLKPQPPANVTPHLWRRGNLASLADARAVVRGRSPLSSTSPATHVRLSEPLAVPRARRS